MAINNKLKFLMLAALFLSGLSAVRAQTANYFLDPDSETPRFIQRLSWSGGTYALHCEIIIEREEGAGYVDFLDKFTNGNFFDISLPPGNYRFRVIPYDILGKPSEASRWAEFKVYNAVKPEIYKPEEELEYYNDNQGSKFEFNGRNIEPDAQVYFVNSKGEYIFPSEIIRSDDGSSLLVAFDKNQLVDGEYEVFIINPGGLETSLGGIDYKTYREKSFGLMHYIFGVSFMPSFQVFGGNFGSERFLFHINARISMISCLFSNNYIGMEFTFSNYTKFLNEIEYFYGDDNSYSYYQYENIQNGFTLSYNLLFVNWLPGRNAAVNFRIGGGFELQPMELSFINMGVSFMYRIYGIFNIEAGVNFPRSLIDNSIGNVNPWVGLTIIF
jgi:hypothetical protein